MIKKHGAEKGNPYLLNKKWMTKENLEQLVDPDRIDEMKITGWTMGRSKIFKDKLKVWEYNPRFR